VVIYDDNIIGKGANTVFRDGNIAGHAEINALNDAIDALGMDTFLKLDRDRLSLISTYEPCEMCRGMFIHYRIFHVSFLKSKPWSRWIKNDRAALLYEWHKTKTGDGHLQDSLFLLHPEYPGKK
jgi:tRNA(Arg) A34 adenosine deaminase TadA